VIGSHLTNNSLQMAPVLSAGSTRKDDATMLLWLLNRQITFQVLQAHRSLVLSTMVSACLGGVFMSQLLMLELEGCRYKVGLMSTEVPSFVSTFLNPVMSAFSPASLYYLQTNASHDVTDRSSVLASPGLDQQFVADPGFSPIPAKLVMQILVSKYIDLSDLLSVNLLQKEPGLQ